MVVQIRVIIIYNIFRTFCSLFANCVFFTAILVTNLFLSCFQMSDPLLLSF